MRASNVICMIALAASGLARSAAGQPAQCSQQTVTGVYALAYQGFALMQPPGASQVIPVPGAGLAIVSIDSEGAMTSTGYQTIGGNMQYGPMGGTITVRPDCTGTVVWAGGSAAVAVVADGGNEISTMVVQSPLGAMIVSGNWKRISRVPSASNAAPCAPTAVFGTYSAKDSGFLGITPAGGSQPSFLPGGTIGIASLRRDGTVAGRATASIAGQIAPLVFTGEFQAGTDCTGTMSFTAPMGGPKPGELRAWFVVLDGGDTLWTIALANPAGKPVTIGTMERISRTTAGIQ